MKYLSQQIKLHEGYRDKVYYDSKGFLTCGWGHLLQAGSLVPLEASEAFFKQDLREAFESYTKLNRALRKKLNDARTRVIIEMIFNLGFNGFLKFIKMQEAILIEDWDLAAKEMLNSEWATQVKQRAIDLASIMRSGVDGSGDVQLLDKERG